ncbi:MAG: CatB-related O-acetyltransferase [Methylotenera sp.]|nr:CatB-related O-acetyltransferase [Methylotenera sp.]MDD4925323.1 CatB-related O-acetyltransferase [Methylotenera sp.]
MNSLKTWVKTYIRELLIRKKFPNSVIYSGANVDPTCVLGEHSVLFQNVALMNSSLGAYSYVQSESVVCNTEIGKFCSIASGVNIGLVDHPMHMVSTSPVFYDNSQPLPKFLTNGRVFTEALPRTVIGADVWIGQGVMIKAGVKIGVGAVIGAGAVVTKDVAPYIIAAGNPCRQIRPRFSEDIISRLIASKWWALSDKQLEKLSCLFVDPVKLLDELERSR